MTAQCRIRSAVAADVPAIVEIYNAEVLYSFATFDTEPVTVEARRRWLARRDARRHPVVVADAGGDLAGWASLSRWSEKGAYARAAEVSVYVDRAWRGRQIGKALLAELIERGRQAGLGVLLTRICRQGGEASLRLHEHLGFRRVGTLRAVGEKFGQILDVELLDLALGP